MGSYAVVRNFGAKHIEFFEIYGVSARRREDRSSHCGHFVNKEGGGLFFAILCGRRLWTAPKTLQSLNGNGYCNFDNINHVTRKLIL